MSWNIDDWIDWYFRKYCLILWVWRYTAGGGSLPWQHVVSSFLGETSSSSSPWSSSASSYWGWGPPCLAASWRSRPSSRCEGQPPCPPSPFPWSPIAAPILPSALGFSSPRRGIKNSKAPGKIADYNFYKVLKRFGSGIPHLKVLKHFTEYIPQLNNPSIKVQPAWVRSRLSSKLCLHCWSPR